MGYEATIEYKGDWDKLQRFLAGKWKNELIAAFRKATKKNALFVLAEIRTRIREQKYAPNAPYTIKRKGHDRVLVDTGRMIKALSVQEKSETSYEVGFLKDQKASHGNATLFNIVPILHDGMTYSVETARGRRTIRIPPRPFLRSVWEDPAVIRECNKNWEEAVKGVLKKHGNL